MILLHVSLLIGLDLLLDDLVLIFELVVLFFDDTALGLLLVLEFEEFEVVLGLVVGVLYF